MDGYGWIWMDMGRWTYKTMGSLTYNFHGGMDGDEFQPTILATSLGCELLRGWNAFPYLLKNLHKESVVEVRSWYASQTCLNERTDWFMFVQIPIYACAFQCTFIYLCAIKHV
jgi:hypothetical protein